TTTPPRRGDDRKTPTLIEYLPLDKDEGSAYREIGDGECDLPARGVGVFSKARYYSTPPGDIADPPPLDLGRKLLGVVQRYRD
ncbi:hypothetical protein H0H93_004251, partial [Arthromyces matolae]